jgi:hypothetical protein
MVTVVDAPAAIVGTAAVPAVAPLAVAVAVVATEEAVPVLATVTDIETGAPMKTAAGEGVTAVTAKSGSVGCTTVSVNVVGAVGAGLPVTVTVVVTGRVLDGMLIVRVSVNVGLPVADGVNRHVAPVGSPLEHDNVTG